MKKRLLFVLAVVAAFALVAATPVSACHKDGRHKHQPPSGHTVMVLNADPAGGPLGLYGCEGISWFGTIKIKGKTFGMATYPDPDYVGPGEFQGVEYGEGWKIFTGKFRVKDGVLKRCVPGRVLMAGYGTGTWDPVGGEFQSDGSIEYAARHFKRWLNGYRVHQSGTTGPGVSVAGVTDAYGVHNGVWEIYRP